MIDSSDITLVAADQTKVWTDMDPALSQVKEWCTQAAHHNYNEGTVPPLHESQPATAGLGLEQLFQSHKTKFLRQLKQLCPECGQERAQQ